MSSFYKTLKKYHKWIALIFTLFFIFFAISGILMNHRTLISKVDVKRKWLPKEYQLNSWNLASVKGSVDIGKDSIIMYGGAGIWLTNTGFTFWKPLMDGLPIGSDNRKIFDLVVTGDQSLYAGTRFGLYHLKSINKNWEKVSFSDEEEFVTALEYFNDSLWVLTRNSLFVAKVNESPENFNKKVLIPPVGAKPEISIFRLFWIIHSGEILGIPGRLIVDMGGLIMLFLSITGFLYFLFPKLLKRVKNKEKRSRIKRINRFSFKWHLKIGIISSALLLLVSFTGIFLRPPFLILVANSGFTQTPDPLNYTNVFWDDKLRDIRFDRERNLILLATSMGIFYNQQDLTRPFEMFKLQPTISIMGINTFEVLPNGDYLVGSFSGAFRWNPYKNYIFDYFTGEQFFKGKGLSSPFGANAIAGYTKINGIEYFFDYDKGIFSKGFQNGVFQMPEIVKVNFPFPLWNLAQEFHTGRIYSPLLGSFYILIVPFAGMALLIITTTGTIMWFIKRKRQKKESIIRQNLIEAGNNPSGSTTQ